MTLDEVPWRSVLAAGETAWVVGLVVFIVLERRPPVSTLAWIFGLVLLPFLGLPVYFLFGPRRLRRRKLRYRDKRVAVTHALANAHERMPTPYATRLAGIGEKLQHTHVSTATRVELFYEGDDAYDAILRAIERANDHVHVEYYIFESDEVGAKLRDALTAAAKRGVEVRLLVDAVGSSGAGRRFFDDVTRAGGQVRRFQPPRLGLARARFFNFRTHRKMPWIPSNCTESWKRLMKRPTVARCCSRSRSRIRLSLSRALRSGYPVCGLMVWLNLTPST